MDDDSFLRYLDLLIKRGCKIQFKTRLFGKPYVWLTDPYGNYFIERLPND